MVARDSDRLAALSARETIPATEEAQALRSTTRTAQFLNTQTEAAQVLGVEEVALMALPTLNTVEEAALVALLMVGLAALEVEASALLAQDRTALITVGAQEGKARTEEVVVVS